MKCMVNNVLSAALFAFLFLSWGGVQAADAAPLPLDTSRTELVSGGGLPGDYLKPGVKGSDCVETCSIQEEYYGDEGNGEEQYEEEYDDGGGMYGDEAGEQYDDEYGDEEFQEDVYPEEQYEGEGENGEQM